MSQLEPPPAKASSNAGFYAAVIIPILAAIGVMAYLNRDALRPTPKVAIVTSTDDSYWDLVIKGARDAAKDYNVELTAVRSKPDEPTQSQHVRNLLGEGMHGIGISPVDPVAQQSLLAQVGTESRLVTFDSDAPNSKRVAFVGSNNYLAGWLAGDEIRKAIPDGGEVIICVGTVDKVNGRERRQAIIDHLLDRPYDASRPADPLDGVQKGAKYSVVATFIDNGDFKNAVAMAAQAARERPNLKCFAGLFNINTPAIVRALDKSKKTGEIKVVGFDEADETQRGVASGAVAASVLQDQYVCGYETVRLLAEAARGVNKGRPGGNQLHYLHCRILDRETIGDLRREGRIRVVEGLAVPAPAPATEPATVPAAGA
jgi:ribose transport system substrate-binding protein